MIGSTGLAVVLAFLDSQDGLCESDDARVEFTKYALDHCRFTFKKSSGDVEVRVQSYTYFRMLTSKIEFPWTLPRPVGATNLCCALHCH